ncbi:MAG: SH3 domain-containing protein [Bacteroidetes bacterium]|nr:SH3 domain-containing protein [Bacteroidota bacterium]
MPITVLINDIRDWILLHPNTTKHADVWEEFKGRLININLTIYTFVNPIYDRAYPSRELINIVTQAKVVIREKITNEDETFSCQDLFENVELSYAVKWLTIEEILSEAKWNSNPKEFNELTYEERYNIVKWNKEKEFDWENAIWEEEDDNTDKEEPDGPKLIQSEEPDTKPREKVPEDIIVEEPIIIEEKENPEPPNKLLYYGSMILVAGVLAILYFVVIKDWIDKLVKGQQLYSITDELLFRSEPNADNDGNKLAAINYGEAVKMLNKNGDWTYVKYNGKRGFVHTKYLISELEFKILDSAFEDEVTRAYIEKSRYKRAILDYYIKQNICGNLSIETQEKLFGKGNSRQVWTIKAYDKNNYSNWVHFNKRAYNKSSKYEDLLFVVKSDFGKRVAVLVSFTDQEAPVELQTQDYNEEFPIVDYSYNYNKKYDAYILQFQVDIKGK